MNKDYDKRNHSISLNKEESMETVKASTEVKLDKITPGEYNKRLVTELPDFVDKITIKGNDLLVRFLIPITTGNIIIPSIELIPSDSGEKLIPKLKEQELTTRAVVISTGDGVTTKYTRGTMIDVKATNSLMAMQYVPTIIKGEDEGNFFLIPESYIQVVWNEED